MSRNLYKEVFDYITNSKMMDLNYQVHSHDWYQPKGELDISCHIRRSIFYVIYNTSQIQLSDRIKSTTESLIKL